MTPKRILFLCSGNYYRSRFSEEHFNHHARFLGLPWVADSKGLRRVFPRPKNPGPISVHTLEALQDLKIEPLRSSDDPEPVHEPHLNAANRIIALSKIEHAPLIQEYFHDFDARIEYWEIGDIHIETPASAVARMIEELDRLLTELNRA